MRDIYLRCNACLAPNNLPNKSGEGNKAGGGVSILLLNCKHLICEPCLFGHGHGSRSSAAPTCPFCKKNGVRYLPIDDPSKMPNNVRTMLFCNPVELYKLATEAWEFQCGHADLINRQLAQKLQGMRQQFERDTAAKRSEIKETEAKAQAQEDRIARLQDEIRKEKALLQELEANEARQAGRGTPEAAAKPRQGYPTGSVTSPPVRRRHPTAVGRSSTGFFESDRESILAAAFKSPQPSQEDEGSSRDGVAESVFKECAGAFKTPNFKK